MFWLGLGLGFILGGLVVGYIIRNNKDKSFKALDKLKKEAEEELLKLKSKSAEEIIKLRKEIIDSTKK